MKANKDVISRLLRSYNIAYSEYACPHCGRVPPNMLYVTDRGEDEFSVEYDALFNVFSQIRNKLGKPIQITSGYRCLDHERSMFYNACVREGTDKPKGKAFVSAHLFGLALDLMANSPAEQRRIVDVAKECFPVPPRIGWKVYRARGKNIVHIDLLPLVCPHFIHDMEEEW